MQTLCAFFFVCFGFLVRGGNVLFFKILMISAILEHNKKLGILPK